MCTSSILITTDCVHLVIGVSHKFAYCAYRSAWERCEPGKALLNADTKHDKTAATKVTDEIKGAIDVLEDEMFNALRQHQDP